MITLTKLSPRRWRLEHKLNFRVMGYPAFAVPAGYVTDGASIPWLFWWFASPMGGNYTRAAIGHDWLCTQGGLGHPIMGPDQAHVFFGDVMELDGVGKLRRLFMGRLVRWFGPRW